MKMFLSKYFFLLALLALVAIMVLGLWLVILPLSHRVALQRDEIQKFHTAREYRSHQIGLLADLREQFEGIIRDESALNILLTDNQMVDFIRIVEAEAKSAQVEITISAKDQSAAILEPQVKKEAVKDKDATVLTKASPKSLADQPPFGRYLPLSIRVIGKYENIVLFLHKIETLPIALDVLSMIVEPSTEEGGATGGRRSSGVNPFQPVLGEALPDGEVSPLLSPEDKLKATFELLVYADKKTE